MSSNTNHALTKEQLFACVEYDGLKIGVAKINQAKNGDGEALRDIGCEYDIKLENYSKAMSWYQLAINQNSAGAYNNIGVLYSLGQGVSQDRFIGMEYYLKAARGNEDTARTNIADSFLNGNSVPIDKYKALEWFISSRKKPEKVKELNQQGIHVREEDKNKTIYQLINEAYDILLEESTKKESKLEQEMENLSKDYQKLQNESQQKQQLKEKDEIITLLRSLVQSKTNEIELLQKDNQRLRNLEQSV